MKFELKVWRQSDSKSGGRFADYSVDQVGPDTSFLEMMDILNEQLTRRGEEPVAFVMAVASPFNHSDCITPTGQPWPQHGPLAQLLNRKDTP